MWTNLLKVTFRHLRKHKLFTAIKLIGLAIGFHGCLLIGLYLHNELSYDAGHKNADRIVRTTMEYHVGGKIATTQNTGNKVGPTFRSEFPEVENTVRVIKYDNRAIKLEDKEYVEDNFYYADSSFFDVFTFPLIAGNPQQALTAPNQVVLNETMAKKFFGTASPMGKSIVVDEQPFQVVGVMQDAPINTQIRPAFLASFISLPDAAAERETWWNANYGTYLLLHNGDDRAALEAKLLPFMRSRSGETGLSGDDYVTYHLEPLLNVHLRSSVEGNFEPNGDIRYIYLLGAVGLLILFIGVTTYINLTTAAGMERAREVGVQKILGAGRMQLLAQHLGEAAVLAGVSLAVSYALIPPLLPLFNRLFDRELTAAPLLQPMTILGVVAFWALISLLSGAYPAFVASNYKPMSVLKGNLGESQNSGVWLRRSLIVFQFGISGFLLISTLLLQQQMQFIQHKKLGYDKDHVLALPTDQKIIGDLDAFKSEFLQNNNVTGVSLAYETPTHIEGGYGIAKSVTGADGKPVTALPSDQDFIATMGMEMAAGKSFDRNDIAAVQSMYKGDTTVVRSILINEKQTAAFGWTPEEAVGQLVNFNGRPAKIKGVVKDFHFASLHEPIDNLVIFPDTWGNALLVNLTDQDMEGTIAFLEKKWHTLAPHRPFKYHFLDEEFDQLYGAEMQTARLITSGCALAILLACMGLFGLASYATYRRTKEIGIRKVLGANVLGIVGLLSRDFLVLVVVALVIASPLAWYLMNGWLENFAYRIEIHWWVFLLAGVASVAIAFLTVSFQSVKAALANPVESLRSE